MSKALQKSRQMTSVAFPLSTNAITPSQKATRQVRHYLSFMKQCWLPHVFQEDLFPGTDVRLISLQFPGSSFLPFLNTGVFFFFPVISGLCLTATTDVSKMIECLGNCISQFLQNPGTHVIWLHRLVHIQAHEVIWDLLQDFGILPLSRFLH